VTSGERAELLLAEAVRVAREMRVALEPGGWNLAVRRAQEVVELVAKALLNAMGIDYPRTHDPAPVLVEAIRTRGLEADETLLGWLRGLSAHLADIRSPAFYQEIAVAETEAREAAEGAERVLAFGRDLLDRLRTS
jgi:HEPN domain-containing protein